MKIKKAFSAIAITASALALPLSVVAPASAATQTWEGINASTNDSVNWGSSSIANGDTLVFPASAIWTSPVHDSAATVFDSILFNGTSPGTSSDSFLFTSSSAITVTSAISALMAGVGGDHQIHSDVTLGGDVTLSTSGSNTLTVGDGAATGSKGGGDTIYTIDLGTNDLTLDASGGSISVLGVINGSGNVIKKGEGNLMFLASNGSGYTGSTTVEGGELNVGASDLSLAGDIIISGGRVVGSGSVGKITMTAGALAPGQSPGVINSGDLTLTGGTYEVELGGTGDGEYDRVNVTGAVDLGTATSLDISLVNSYEPAVNDVFTIVSNDGTDAVVGNFNGLANGEKVTLNGYTYQLNYDAGDGNDVLMLVTGTPSAPDTGVGSLDSNVILPAAALLAAAAILGGAKIAAKRK